MLSSLADGPQHYRSVLVWQNHRNLCEILIKKFSCWGIWPIEHLQIHWDVFSQQNLWGWLVTSVQHDSQTNKVPSDDTEKAIEQLEAWVTMMSLVVASLLTLWYFFDSIQHFFQPKSETRGKYLSNAPFLVQIGCVIAENEPFQKVERFS